MSNLWPSQQTSTSRQTKSTYKPKAIPTDWNSALLTMFFVIVLVAGVVMALQHFVFAPAMEQLELVTDTLKNAGRP